MPKLQCPQCKAMNQDVSADDPCWQCGAVLGAPVKVAGLESGTPSDAGSAPSPAGNSVAPVQKQVTRPQEKAPLEERYGATPPNYAAIAVIVAVLRSSSWRFCSI